MRLLAIGMVFLIAGCRDRAQPFTLYRNSNVDASMRIYFATFDANGSAGDYNMTNCEMAARLLNANIHALAKANQRPDPASLGFWCEPGQFKATGRVPLNFGAKFPTDVGD